MLRIFFGLSLNHLYSFYGVSVLTFILVIREGLVLLPLDDLRTPGQWLESLRPCLFRLRRTAEIEFDDAGVRSDTVFGEGMLVSGEACDHENPLQVKLLVHGKLARLAEGAHATGVVADEGFLLGVDVHVLFKILRQSEGLEAQDAHVTLHR